MDKATNEQSFYALQHDALNEPKRYIAEYDQAKGGYHKLPTYLRSLSYAKALFVMGEIKQGFGILAEIKPEIHSSKDNLSLAKYYLTLHNVVSNAATQPNKAEEYLQLAVKYAKQCGSKALLCELKILEAHAEDSTLTLDMKEDLLQEAMQYAMEADILDLRLDVYLAYCPIYISANMPERANRELQLLMDTVREDTHPHYMVQINNYLGIIHQMLNDYPKSEIFLQQAIQSSITKGYRLLHAIILINYGLCMMHNRDYQQAIDIYTQSRDMYCEFGLENSLNASKVMGNLARVLGIAGRLDEAICILRDSVDYSKNNNDQQRENSQKVNLADVLIEKSEFAEVEQLLSEAIGYFTKNNSHRYLSLAYLCKARMYEEREQYQEAFEAMEQVYSAYQKYFNENFQKVSAMHQARINKLRTEYMQLKNQYDTDCELKRLSQSTDLIGEHPSVKKAIKDAMMAARFPFTHVIITGESGTGKEIIARIIHNESKTGKPLVAVNASAISPNLFESELFGHKRGAYTGAMEDRKGKFLLADKGTLLLDEISEMPVEAQVKLLRAIETHTIQPVGSDKEIQVNCRIICTSNKDIRSLIHSNQFRLDLYHRLNKVEIHLLPLRERLSDLELIAGYYVERFSRELRVPKPTLSDGFYNRLKAYSFPGNIRELVNLIERIFILNPNSLWEAGILDGILPETPRLEQPSTRAISQHLRSTEADLITDALVRCNWVQKEAAKLLNMSESTLCRHIKHLRIAKP